MTDVFQLSIQSRNLIKHEHEDSTQAFMLIVDLLSLPEHPKIHQLETPSCEMHFSTQAIRFASLTEQQKVTRPE